MVDEGSTNRFVLSDNDDQPEENDRARCSIRVYQQYPKKVFQLTVDKNETVAQFYKQVLKLCHTNDLDTNYFCLTFNQRDTTDEVVKVC